MAHEIVTFTDLATDPPREVGEHRVYIRAQTADDWTYVPEMHALDTVWSQGPTLSTATLLWRYGTVLHSRGIANQWLAELKRDSDNRAQVRIEHDCHRDPNNPGVWLKRSWWGIIEFNDDEVHGTTADGVDHGVQTIAAYGLEKLLFDHAILTSWTAHDASGQLVPLELGRPLIFNERGKPNRNTVAGGHVFWPFEIGSLWWSSRTIVEYLLQRQTPLDRLGNRVVNWSLSPGGVVPTWDKPVIDPQKSTTGDLVNRLLDRRRLQGWDVRVTNDAAGSLDVALVVNSMAANDVPINIPAAPDIPKQAETRDLIMSADALTSASISSSQLPVVDQVVVRGARRRHVGSFSFVDNNLARGWTQSQEDDYNTGASNTIGYGALGTRNKQRLNDLARMAPNLRDVFATFKLPDSFDWTVGDGENGAAKTPLFPGPFGLPYRLYFQGMYFEPTLPLEAGIDYGGSAIANGVTTTQNGEEMAPLVVFRRPDTSPEQWIRADDVGHSAESEPLGDGAENWRFSVGVQIPEFSRTLHLRVNGEKRHAIALLDFTQLPVDPGVGHADWKGGMIFTVSMQSDFYLEAKYPTNPLDRQGKDYSRKRLIDAGPRYFRNYVAPNTVVGVNADGSLKRSTGGYIPKVAADDNAAHLAALARIAGEWYLNEHKQLVLQTKRLKTKAELELGNMITSASGQNVNAPITRISIQVPIDPIAPEPVMHVQTFAGELEARQLSAPAISKNQQQQMPMVPPKHPANLLGSGGQ